MLVWIGGSATAPGSTHHSGTRSHTRPSTSSRRSSIPARRSRASASRSPRFRRPEGVDGAAGRSRSEEARRLLDPVLELLIEVGQRDGGIVEQSGRWECPLWRAAGLEDHASGPLRRVMQDAIGRYAAELRRLQGLDVEIRVGLNSGEVVVRSIGSDLHMDYTAVGQTTHLAARVEQLARPGTTLITRPNASPRRGVRRGHGAWTRAVEGVGGPRRDLRALRADRCGLACARPPPMASPDSSGATSRSNSCSARSNEPVTGTARSSPSSESPASGNPACSSSSSIPTGPRAGSSSRASPSRMGKRRRTFRSLISSRPTSTSPIARTRTIAPS